MPAKEFFKSLARRAMASLDKIRPDTTGVFSKYRPYDLKTLDRRYNTMYEMHKDVHQCVFIEMAERGCTSVAEIACGTGFALDLAIANGLSYTGIDISETAISVACLKNDQGDFINLPVDRLDIIKDQSFDAVYNSSMLEHIGFPNHAIASMWRLAKNQMYLMFYEGLSDATENQLNFFAHDPKITLREAGGFYGVKVVRQSHGDNFKSTGYFMNKFSQTAICSFLTELPGAGVPKVRHFGKGDLIRSVVTLDRIK